MRDDTDTTPNTHDTTPDLARVLSSGFPDDRAREFLAMWREVQTIVAAPFSPASVGAVSATWNRWLLAANRSEECIYGDPEGPKVRFAELSPQFHKSLVEALRASLPADRARALYVDELLDQLYYAPRTGSEWNSAELSRTDQRLVIDGRQVMDAWETPIMHSMVDRCLEACTRERPGPLRVLELGWGMGISGRRFLRSDVDYTVVEAHATVAAEAEREIRSSERPGRVVHSLWQDASFSPGSFDVIFFDVYYMTYDPVKNGDYLATVSEFFLPLLADGGVFTYFLSNHPAQIDTLLKAGFDTVLCSRVTEIMVPEDCSYAPTGQQEWLTVVARKGRPGGAAPM